MVYAYVAMGAAVAVLVAWVHFIVPNAIETFFNSESE